MDEVLERVVRVVQQQVFFLHIPEDGLPLVQAGQLHGLRLADGAHGIVRIGQMPQVFHIEVFVARNQFLTVDAEGIYKEVQKIVGHGAVVHKTADGSYLAFFHFAFHLLYNFGCVGGLVYQYVRIPRNLNAVAAVHIVAGEYRVDIGFDDILDEHQVVVLPVLGQFDEAGHLAVGQLHHEVLGSSSFVCLSLCALVSFRIQSYGKVQAVVAQERYYLVLADGYGREIRKDFFPEEAPQEFFMKRLYVAALVEDDVLLPQGRQYFLFVDADTLFQLAVHLFVDFGHQLHGGLHALFIAVCGAGGNGLMVGYTYFVELFQVGRVYGYKVDALVQRQCIVFGFQQYPVVE